ncbi:MAG: hypothetical protein LC122_14425 [Chitinophagales bacterium]|nr:hypothetical protein [Chitinophagales bacterium]
MIILEDTICPICNGIIIDDTIDRDSYVKYFSKYFSCSERYHYVLAYYSNEYKNDAYVWKNYLLSNNYPEHDLFFAFQNDDYESEYFKYMFLGNYENNSIILKYFYEENKFCGNINKLCASAKDFYNICLDFNLLL